MKDLYSCVQNKFSRQTVVVVGDLVADQFLNGTISRVSREAPVFILRHDDTSTRPGAAANAAANIASLGAKACAIGVTGVDEAGELLRTSLGALGVDLSGVVVAEGHSTARKVRVLAGQHYAARQQVIRIDYESSGELSSQIKNRMLDALDASSKAANAIILSDYGYGAVFPEMIARAGSLSAELGIPLIVDSRFRLETLTGATSATPNREEVEQILGPGFDDAACSGLRERLGLSALLVTNGNKGMKLFEPSNAPIELDVIGSAEPVDVTGAGDTVIAAYSLGLASGLSFADAARVANHAGGIVVMKKGTATVSHTELVASLASVTSDETFATGQ